jgi:hypothetical protein
MSTYTPDRWVLVKIQAVGHEPYYRVLASWYGGFTQGDSWKLSSGVEKSIDHGTHYEFPQSSGSIYMCHKGAHGMSMYTSGVFANFKADCEKTGMLFELVDEKFVPMLEVAPPKVEVKAKKPRKPRKLTKAELKDYDF